MNPADEKDLDRLEVDLLLSSFCLNLSSWSVSCFLIFNSRDTVLLSQSKIIFLTLKMEAYSVVF